MSRAGKITRWLWIIVALLAALAGCGDAVKQVIQTRIVSTDPAIIGAPGNTQLIVQIDLADSRGLHVQTLSPNVTAAVARLSGPLLNDPPRSITIPVASFSPTPAVVTTLAGSATGGFADDTGTAAKFNSPKGIAVDSSGNIYVADTNNQRIRKITPGGVVTTLAGSGSGGFNDGSGTSAVFNYPEGIAVDGSGNVYVADTNNQRIRKITPGGVVTTLAGSGSGGFNDGSGAAAVFNYPEGVAVDSNGYVYVADTNNQRIRKITPDGTVTTLAGSGSGGFADGSGASAVFNYPEGVMVDSSGYVNVADTNNQRIRKIAPDGTVTTLAGSGTGGFVDGSGTVAAFNFPEGVVVNNSGHVYVADTNNQRIRMITPPSRLASGMYQNLRPGPGYKLEVALYDTATPVKKVLASGATPGSFTLVAGTNTITVTLNLTGAVNLSPTLNGSSLLTNNVVTTGNRILVLPGATDPNSQLRAVRLWLDGTASNNYAYGQLLATWYSDGFSTSFDWNTGATIKSAVIGTAPSPVPTPTPNPFVTATPTPPPPLSFNKLPFTGGITARNADTGGAAAWSPDHNKMYAWAFHTAGTNPAAEFWAYSVLSNSWQQVSAGTIPARGTSIAYDSTNRKVYLYGGWNGSSNFNDFWDYTPATDTWTQRTVSGITGRRNHSMVWDSNFFRLYVFGGITGSATNELWSYNPADNTWTQISTTPAPPARSEHVAVWDSNNNRMIIYGGTSAGFLNDAWSYTPSSPTSGTWKQLSVSGITARGQASAVWDPIRRQMIVCGGQTSGGFVNECWSFDPAGGTWAQITVPASLAARGNHYMVWDTLNNRMLLYGGTNGNPNIAANLFNDLWSLGVQPPSVVAPPAAVATPAPANHTLTFSLHDRNAPQDNDLIRVLTYKFTVAQ